MMNLSITHIRVERISGLFVATIRSRIPRLTDFEISSKFCEAGESFDRDFVFSIRISSASIISIAIYDPSCMTATVLVNPTSIICPVWISFSARLLLCRDQSIPGFPDTNLSIERSSLSLTILPSTWLKHNAFSTSSSFSR